MEYKKERNFIVGYDNGSLIGRWDILTGQFYGKRENTVKSIPTCFSITNLKDNDENLFCNAVKFYRDYFIGNRYFRYIYTDARGHRFEELISVGLYPRTTDDLNSNVKLTKDLVTYLKENYHGIYDESYVKAYEFDKKYKSFLEDKSSCIKNVFRHCIDDIPFEFLKPFLNRAMNEHIELIYKFNAYEITKMVKDYYNICMRLYGEAKVTPNILSNYAQLLYIDEEYKKKHYNEVLKANNDKPFLYFSLNGYEARPILTKEDFHYEGEHQNNCVERLYMERVYNGTTYIVAVRKCDNPDKTYITCEVGKNGLIYQYLAKNNSSPKNSEDFDFKNAYQEHINRVMGE